MSIQATLREIGLNDKEIKVYLELLKRGKSTPATLAKSTRINRATVYNIAQSLQSKGLIVADQTDKSASFAPLPPQSLGQLIERPKRELEAKSELIKEAIDSLSLVAAGKDYPVPRMRFVQESELNDFLYENTERWQKATLQSDGIWWGFQDHSLIVEYRKWIDWYWKTPLGKKCQVKVFSNSSEVEKDMSHKHDRSIRDVRHCDDMDFTSSVWVAGDYLIMIITRQHPFYLFEIHDKLLAHNMREVFKKLWNNNVK